MLVYEGDDKVRPFVFIHIQKTGGLSVEWALRERVAAEHPAPKHVPARRIRQLLSGRQPFNEYYRFAFVRNPFERLVSWYSMIDEAARGERVWRDNALWRYAYEHGETFEQFVKECVATRMEFRMPGNALSGGARYSFAANQLDYLTGQKGAMLVDRVGHFENFAHDMRRIFSEIGLSLPEVPHYNATAARSHYSEWYTPETREIVADVFAKDIEHFGYSF